MFLGSDEAGPRAAVLCTIIAGAKRHRLEPWAYLHDVILQLSVDASPEHVGPIAAGPLGSGASGARSDPSPRGIATEGAAARPHGPSEDSGQSRSPRAAARLSPTARRGVVGRRSSAHGALGISDAYVCAAVSPWGRFRLCNRSMLAV